MDDAQKKAIAAKAIEEIHELIAANGAAPSVKTLNVYALMGAIGNVMKDAGSRKKVETFSTLCEMGQRRMDSGEPEKIAEGLLIGAFVATCFDVSKLR